jgi:hypothetical protein
MNFLWTSYSIFRGSVIKSEAELNSSRTFLAGGEMSLTVAVLGFFFLVAVLLAKSRSLAQPSLPKRPPRHPQPEERTPGSPLAAHLRD